MPTIDIVTTNRKDNYRFESDTVPRIGETVTCLDLNKTWEVTAVDHLLKTSMGFETRLDLITLQAKLIEQLPENDNNEVDEHVNRPDEDPTLTEAAAMARSNK
jgi:hypothetical protein